ncbi:hypothetical protein TMatcc_007321 [Talaromyces marneffei ATCC 18224]|uniref:Uncharacterized protein n=1 Tax=Talaromyces marneffei (strain ATCC 18224 / CBS 334.59 / QM 7333) TaxID=441960 RepID=B6QFL0_TALMQ|nr:uncharacterized protein EYB26_004295 [Talaromyces marneffei]EEA24245.1 conserved hypothetical protein [Talaromyces marneffei ATCC 18224]KAE8553243.1 hypothetical protein EYB25_004625 [Talaromyces marneffei]QGA16628.1 hypothetical protein EYB26_004295 [Talaromyces marneffei]
MNTIKSTWYGWGVLCVAGGGAYYFAKKSVNADRAARYEADMRRKTQLAAIEAEDRRRAAASGPPQETRKPTDDPSLQRANAGAVSYNARDDVASPSREAGQDPAPTRHEPETDEQGLREKSKYEATQTFRPPRGNRFS